MYHYMMQIDLNILSIKLIYYNKKSKFKYSQYVIPLEREITTYIIINI